MLQVADRRGSGAAEGRRLHPEVRRSAVTRCRSDVWWCSMGVVAILDTVIHSDRNILGGTPVFRGTRVPLKNLVDYLTAGDSLDEFLDHFPSVKREQAMAVLELAAKELLPACAHPSR